MNNIPGAHTSCDRNLNHYLALKIITKEKKIKNRIFVVNL